MLVVGAPVFTYYPYIPGPVLPEGTSLVLVTNDPQEAARAPAGDAIVADVALTLEALLAHAETPDRPPPEARPAPELPPDSSPIAAAAAMAALGEVLPAEGIVVNESPSNMIAFRNQVRPSRPSSYFTAAGGGLGFGLPAAVGMQLGSRSGRWSP